MRASELINELKAEIGVHGDCEITLRFEDSSFETTDLDLLRIEHDPLQGEFPIRGPQFILVAGDG